MDNLGSRINAMSKPLEIFEEWMTAAKSNSAIREPTAMTVSTASAAGEVRSRVVLCKQWTDAGFQFYTNYDSRKGRDLAENPRTALLFYWDPLFRQIKISGVAAKIPRSDSEKYWRSRPRESQLSQYASRQSEVISSREELENICRLTDQKFKGQEIPCPEHWGGYLVRPSLIEFWIGRPGRLHERYQFEKAAGTWTFRLLCP